MLENMDLNKRVETLESTVKDLQIKIASLTGTSSAISAEGPSGIFLPEFYSEREGALKFCVEYKDKENIKKREYVYAASLESIKQRIRESGGIYCNGWVSFEEKNRAVKMRTANARGETVSALSAPIKSEDILNKVGMGLLLLGLAFFFKYAVDQGWLTPATRIAMGFLLGMFLVGLGIVKNKKHPKFSRVLEGGGIAAFYVTVYSAFQLYEFFTYPAAFVFMIVITALGFILSVQQLNPVLSLISLAGGMGTPFILYSGNQNIAGLVLYSSVFLISAALIYGYRGWWILVPFSGAGMWLILFTGYFAAISGKSPVMLDKVSLQGGIVFALAMLGGLAITKEYFQKTSPARWPDTPYRKAEDMFARHSEHMLVVSGPFLSLAMSEELWTLSDKTWGWITLAVGAAYGGIRKLLKQRGYGISYTHGITGILVGTFGLVQLLHGNTLYTALAAEAVVLHFVGAKFKDKLISAIAHVIFIVESFWLMNHLLDYQAAKAFLNPRALSDLFVIAMAMAASVIISPRGGMVTYQSIGHFAVLCLCYREFDTLVQGQAYTTVIWGLYAIGILILGIFLGKNHIRTSGLVVIFAVVGKLFLIDLSAVAAVWRVLLFMGFGGALLALSYHLPRWMSKKGP